MSTKSKTAALAEELVEEGPEAIQAKLKELQDKIDALQAADATKDKIIEDLSKHESGWLAITPNPVYDGPTAGITFVSGMAFLPDSGEYPRFELQVPKESQLEKMDPEVREAVLERCKRPAILNAVDELRNDFGYEVIRIEDKETLNKMVSARAIERANAEALLRAQAEALQGSTRHLGR